MSDKPKVLIQVREYPYKPGKKTRGLVIEGDDLETAFLRLEVLYKQLEKEEAAEIVFYR